MANRQKKDKETPPRARAILFTDMVGSTHYFATHGDIAGMRLLDQHNRALFPIVEMASGRIVKTIGDSIFAVFEQPTNALTAAWAMQQRLKELRASAGSGDEIRIRVGVHYGLVTEKGNDFFGDAVNFAARVESQAGGDEILVSSIVRDMVRARPEFVFESKGIRELKGAAEPMELFLLTASPALTPPSPIRKWAARAWHVVQRRRLEAATVALFLIVGAAAWWYMRPSAVLDDSAVAVLPLRNLAHDQPIDYLSLALTSELDAQLSRTTSVIVRPLESVRTYKDRGWTAPDVAQALRVGTVVGGSYWRAGQQLRVSVDIIDSKQNRQVWSESFQAVLSDLLSLVDLMVPKVVGALRVRLGVNPIGSPIGTKNTEVYELYLRGIALGLDITDANNESAIRLLKQAAKLDPGFARAHAALAEAYVTRFWWNFSNDTVWLDLAEESAREALKLDPTLPEAHNALAYALEGKGQRANAAREYFASLLTAPHNVAALVNVARYSFYMADFDRALTMLDTIARIDPTMNVHIRRAMCFYFAGRLKESRIENREAEKHARGVDQLTLVAFTHVWLKDLDSAERVLRRLEKEQPSALSISEIRAWIYTARGQLPQAREQMQIIAKRPTFGIADEIATLYAIQGDREEAIEWLTKAVRLGAPNYAWYNSDFFKVLRGDPRYEAILKELSEEYRPLRSQATGKPPASAALFPARVTPATGGALVAHVDVPPGIGLRSHDERTFRRTRSPISIGEAHVCLVPLKRLIPCVPPQEPPVFFGDCIRPPGPPYRSAQLWSATRRAPRVVL
jgi:adenylate cyclase